MSCLSHGNHYGNYFTPIFTLCLALLSVLSAYIKPCKSSIANLSLTFHFTLMAVINHSLEAGFEYGHIGACSTLCNFHASPTRTDVSMGMPQNSEEIPLATKNCHMDQFYIGST